jgi:hypothetical protein
MSQQPIPVVPYSFDLSRLVPRSVASLYSNLITRPTGRALRVGIETQIAELGGCCLSVLDFTQVVVLDYSCADEIVAKLILHYRSPERPRDVYFVARGLGEQHRDPIEAVLDRHRLLLVAEAVDSGFTLLGAASAFERLAWSRLQLLRSASVEALAGAVGAPVAETRTALESLAARRTVLRMEGGRYLALSTLLQS